MAIRDEHRADEATFDREMRARPLGVTLLPQEWREKVAEHGYPPHDRVPDGNHLLKAYDASYYDEGGCCAIGRLCLAVGIDLSSPDPESELRNVRMPPRGTAASAVAKRVCPDQGDRNYRAVRDATIWIIRMNDLGCLDTPRRVREALGLEAR